jgi:hypothetical protein
LLGTLPVDATSLYSLRSDILDSSALASFTIGRAMCVLLRCEVSAMCISARYSLLSVAVAHDGIDGDEQPQSPRAPSNRTPVTTKKRTTYPAGTERGRIKSGGAALVVATPPAPTPPVSAQENSVRRPHSTEPPSSTDHSKGVSPNSLPSLSTQLSIAIVRCETAHRVATGSCHDCSVHATASSRPIAKFTKKAWHFCRRLNWARAARGSRRIVRPSSYPTAGAVRG